MSKEDISHTNTEPDFKEETEPTETHLCEQEEDPIRWKEETAGWFVEFMTNWYKQYGFQTSKEQATQIIEVIKSLDRITLLNNTRNEQ